MAVYKNISSQKIAVYAYDPTTAAGSDPSKTGDAVNITAQISLDGGVSAATNDVNPTELDAVDHPGIYIFDLTQAETNADMVIISAVSATANILLDPIQVFTLPGDSTALAADTIEWSGTAVTLSTGNKPDVNVDEWGDVLLATTDPLPNAVPGATGGLFIAGTNAATTVTTSFTTTFTGSLTGSVASVTGAVGSVTAPVTAGAGNAAFFQGFFTVNSTEVSGGEVTGSVILETAKVVWDRLLTGANHNIATSAGRRLRALNDFGVYEGGQIWIDTINGTAGTTDFENGTVNNPVDNLADAITLAASIPLTGFRVINGSTLTFAESHTNETWMGVNWTLALGGQSVSGSFIKGANVSGICTGASPPQFEECDIGATTVPPCRINGTSGFTGTLTLGSAGQFDIIDCTSLVAGVSTPTIDLGAAIGPSDLNVRGWEGGLALTNVASDDKVSLEGVGGAVVVSGAGGVSNVFIRGIFDSATDNTTTGTSIFQEALLNRPALVGYEGAAVWVDTNNGTTGETIDYVNGTTTNPVDALADAYTIATSLNLKVIHVLPQSDVTLPSNSSFREITGEQYTIALNGANIEGTTFRGATSVTGIATGGSLADPPSFFLCGIGTVTLPPSNGLDCGFFGTFTISSAGDYTFGASADIFNNQLTLDYGAALNASQFFLRNWAGGNVEIQNAGANTGTYVFDFAGRGSLVINANCSDTTNVTLRGSFDITNNSAITSIDEIANIRSVVDLGNGQSLGQNIADMAGSGFTSTDTLENIRDEIVVVDGIVDAILVDTNDIQTRLPVSLIGGLMSSDVTAISTSTDAADKLEASAETILTPAAVAGTLSTTQMSTNLTEVTDDHYNGRVIIWTSGALLDQATDITDYTGATKVLTFTAITEAPMPGDTFNIV